MNKGRVIDSLDTYQIVNGQALYTVKVRAVAPERNANEAAMNNFITGAQERILLEYSIEFLQPFISFVQTKFGNGNRLWSGPGTDMNRKLMFGVGNCYRQT